MNIFEAYNKTKKELESAGIEDYVFEAKQIIKHITGFSNTEILMNYTNQLTEYQSNNLTAIIKQRAIRYPLQYIFGEWSFYGREFYVGPGVLVPRADTETLVDVCLKYLENKESPAVLDLCAGSGCIGITLVLEKAGAAVTLVEKFPEAARYAERNIKRLGADNVTLICGDVLNGAANDKNYDLIVSNPPYIPKNEMKTVSTEVHYEPETALLGGEDGLDFYRAIIAEYKKALKVGGMLAFEVGAGEAAAAEKLLENAGFKEINNAKDLSGISRAVYGLKG